MYVAVLLLIEKHYPDDGFQVDFFNPVIKFTIVSRTNLT